MAKKILKQHPKAKKREVKNDNKIEMPEMRSPINEISCNSDKIC
jgi:hypothetical protein